MAVAVEALGAFRDRYSAAWSAGMRTKLGLPADVDAAEASRRSSTDLRRAACRPTTSTTRRSSAASARRRAATPSPRAGCSSTSPASTRGPPAGVALGPDADAMDRTNPVYVPRNHLVEEALAAATDGDLAPLDRLLEAVSAPYDERPGLERYAEPAPDDVRRLHDLLRHLSAGSHRWSVEPACAAGTGVDATGEAMATRHPDVRAAATSRKAVGAEAGVRRIDTGVGSSPWRRAGWRPVLALIASATGPCAPLADLSSGRHRGDCVDRADGPASPARAGAEPDGARAQRVAGSVRLPIRAASFCCQQNAVPRDRRRGYIRRHG